MGGFFCLVSYVVLGRTPCFDISTSGEPFRDARTADASRATHIPRCVAYKGFLVPGRFPREGLSVRFRPKAVIQA